ncbi:hypothetical protein DICPUDRAFT_98606 [Dictyostelium purpureum]|uniref:Uncharacterized protein n=1 Tax=Dictyostelium purpureum TaxID=5786 RepID=F0ZS01_DICPU|nr:uncharacterized protein DICPUDRAFT_98606 [Dictyostelium purpureum]EGC33297.1 hypothetical protein DICPUDRAFT_98606 [Dictyostelium purpureum]|eukprot:XP_003290198.1 hypothetical protein DICPUDRAFT_98606 [Dictyostelium purpureum]
MAKEIIIENKNENNTLKIKNFKLNQMIFNDIIPYLIYKKKFKVLLEFSLISKQSFKIIQNIVTHQQKQLRLVLGDKSSMISYIDNCSQYENKLIQYKEMEYLRTRDNDTELDFLKTKYLGLGSYCKFKTNWRVYSKRNSIKFKEYILKNCPSMKKVHLQIELLSKVFDRVDGVDQECYDYTEGGFYKFDRLWTEVWADQLPVSNGAEYDDVWSETPVMRRLYNYSFEYINLYKPRKFTITHCDSTLIYNPFKLLQLDCIESLDVQHRTSSRFIEEALKSKTLKTLYVYFISEKKIEKLEQEELTNQRYKGEDKDNDEDKEYATLKMVESGDEDEEKDVYYSISRNEVIIRKSELLGRELVKSFEGLSQNTTLRKLQINIDQYYYCRNPAPLFDLLKSSGNQTLNKLSIPGYRITRSKLLSPLIGIPTITTLYFEASFFFQYNCKSFKAFLDHANQNPNISTFKCLLVYNAAGFKPILKRLGQYFKENTNKPITIVLIFSIPFNSFTTNHNCEDIKHQLIQQLLISGNNNIIKLLFKYKVGKKEYNNDNDNDN